MTGGAFAERGDVAERAEVVVIGTGAGGAVVACELAEAGVDVLLLEEGDHPDQDSRNAACEVLVLHAALTSVKTPCSRLFAES